MYTHAHVLKKLTTQINALIRIQNHATKILRILVP